MNPHDRPLVPARLMIAIGLLALLAIAWRVLIFDPTMATGGDNAMYLMLARNLLEGRAYGDTGYVASALAYLAPATYPPVFPLALVPALALFGLNIPAIKLYMLGLLAIALLMSAWAGAIRLADRPDRVRLVVALAVLLFFNARFGAWASLILSETVFIALAMATLIILHQGYARRAAGQPYGRWVLAACLLLAAALGTRIFGVALIASVFVYELLAYRRLTAFGLTLSGALLAAMAIGALLSWAGWGAIPGGGYATLVFGDLLGNLARLPGVMLANAGHYAGLLARFWLSDAHASDWMTTSTQVITLGSLVLVAIGFAVRVRRGLSVFEVFFVLYFLSLLPWVSYGTRYLMPVLPLYFLYLIMGVAWLERWITAGRPVLLAALVLAGLAGNGATFAATADFNHQIRPNAVNSEAAMQMYLFIREASPPDTLIATRDPRTLALFTRRRALTYTDNPNQAHLPSNHRLITYFDAMQVDYVLASPSDPRRALARLARARPDRLRLVFASGGYVLYRLGRPHAARSGADTLYFCPSSGRGVIPHRWYGPQAEPTSASAPHAEGQQIWCDARADGDSPDERRRNEVRPHGV